MVLGACQVLRRLGDHGRQLRELLSPALVTVHASSGASVCTMQLCSRVMALLGKAGVDTTPRVRPRDEPTEDASGG
jgi:hypothetical protein